MGRCGGGGGGDGGNQKECSNKQKFHVFRVPLIQVSKSFVKQIHGTDRNGST